LEGLTLSASYAYQYVRIPAAVNPYPNAAGVISTLAVPVYQTYTPEHSASGAIDYELPLNGFTIRAHVDGNYDNGYYSTAADPRYVGPGNPTNILQPKTDKAFVVNGRVAVGDIAMGGSDATITFAVWARNLFNEQHLRYTTVSPTSGQGGFFNEQRTIGAEFNIRF
jgi:iron complex outermembrane receptor protein